MYPIDFFCKLRKKKLFELSTRLGMSYPTLRQKINLGMFCEEELIVVAEYLEVDMSWLTLTPEAFVDYLHETFTAPKPTAV